MKILTMMAAVLVCSGVTGCNLKEKYALNNRKADSWLASQRGSGGVQVGGSWESREEVSLDDGLRGKIYGSAAAPSAAGVNRACRVPAADGAAVDGALRTTLPTFCDSAAGTFGGDAECFLQRGGQGVLFGLFHECAYFSLFRIRDADLWPVRSGHRPG